MVNNIKIALGVILLAIPALLVPFLLGTLINTGVLNLLQYLTNILLQTNYSYNVWVGGAIWQILNMLVFRKTK